MNQIHRLILRSVKTLAVPVACGASFAACSSDDGGNATDGGTEAGVSSGGKSSGGASSGGAATGGKAGGTGGAGTGGASTGDSGTGGKAAHPDGGTETPDASDNDGAAEAGPQPIPAVFCSDAGARGTTALVAGTNYCPGCTSEVAAVDLDNGCIHGRQTFSDSDIVPRVSGGHPFVIERTTGTLDVVDASAQLLHSIPLTEVDGGAAKLNPHDVVYAVPPSGHAMAYVSLYNGSAVAVVDLVTNSVVSTVDLSSFRDASDSDGSSDPDVGFYDATANRVYFVLQRTDVNTGFTKPDFIVHCPPVPSVLIGIDVATNALVDLNGAAAGVALPLSLVAPADQALDVAGRRVLLVNNGCGAPEGDGGFTRVKSGVEAVNLDTLATTVLFQPAVQNFYSRIVLLGQNSALLQSFDPFFSTLWNVWSPQSPDLGTSLTGVPDYAAAETATTVVGIAQINGGPVVTRYNVSTQLATTVVGTPWATNVTTAAGVAIVR